MDTQGSGTRCLYSVSASEDGLVLHSHQCSLPSGHPGRHRCDSCGADFVPVEGPRIPQPLAGMVDRLEVQLNLLEEYTRRAFTDGNKDFIPEVANKLRLLLLRSKMNTPLLLEVMDQAGIAFEVRLNLPPGLKDAPQEPLTLDQFFDLPGGGVRTGTGFVTLSKRDLIRRLAEQADGAHADWSVDEALINAFTMPVYINGLQAGELELRNCAHTALHYGRQVVSQARELSSGS